MSWRKREYQISHSYLARTTSDVSMINYDNLAILGKFQDCFLDDASLKEFVAPFLCLNDPYEVCKEDVLRSKWIEENKILAGQFKPA